MSSPQSCKAEVTATLVAIQQVRQTCDHTELTTVKYARKAGLSWAEIATALGVTRQAAWERWHEIDETLPKSDAWGPVLTQRHGARALSQPRVKHAGTSDSTRYDLNTGADCEQEC